MNAKIILIFLSLFFLNALYGQDAFHRTYNSFDEKSLINVSATQIKNGNYVSMDLLINDSDGSKTADSVVITAFNAKGDPEWSSKIAIAEQDKALVPNSGNIVQSSNDSIYFTLVTQNPEKANKIIGCISSEGVMGWMKRYSSIEENYDGEGNHMIASIQDALYTAASSETNENGDLLFSKIDLSGNIAISKLLRAKIEETDVVSFVTAIKKTVNDELILTGIVDSNNISPFITVMDTLGLVQWSKKYQDIENSISLPIATDVLMFSDSTIAISGYYFALNNNLQLAINGFIIKTDTLGEVQWSKKVVFNLNDQSQIKHITLDRNDDILVGGINVDVGDGVITNFIAKLSYSGETIWQKKFPRVESINSFDSLGLGGGLIATQDGGSATFSSVVENETKFITSLIKLDPNGNIKLIKGSDVTCEENIDEEIFFDHSFIADTLIWTSVDTSYSEELMFESDPYTHDVQAITLDVRPFCPNEPIVWTFRTPISGATFYEWSTGVMGPMVDSLTVFDEGEYSVTVTVDERVCYTLCDTAKLTRYSLPMSTIFESLGNFCTNGQITLTAGYMPGHPQIKTIIWSTGATDVISIETGQTGNYAVTITDQCDEVTTASYNLQALPTKMTEAVINKDFSAFCNQATGILIAMGNATGAVAQYRYIWSNGQTTQNISVVQAGTYSVTITDLCGTVHEASIVLPEADFPKLTLNSLTSSLANFCVDRGARLTLSFTGESSSVRWSTGATNTNSIVVNGSGTYSVTVSERTCPNNEIIGTINFVLPPEYDLISSIMLESFPDQGPNCALGLVRVQVNFDGFAQSIVWSSGATNTQAINVTDYIEYGVTVTDFCNSFEAKINIEAPDLTLRYANAFFPETLDTISMERNKTFGPIIPPGTCIEAIQDYEFLIYNRWGQVVFESNAVGTEWNGRFKDALAPAEVYLYRARYTAYGIEKKLGGDVSLIRIPSR